MMYPQPVLPPQPASPSLKSIALIVILCGSVASAIYHLFKKYILAYWFPKKNHTEEKLEQLESRVTKAHELISVQANETKEAMSTLRSFLESLITDWRERERLETIRTSQDEKQLSELKRELSTVRHLIPSVGTFARSVKSSVLQSDVLDEIRNEIASLKNSVKSLVSGMQSGGSLASSLRGSYGSNLNTLGFSSKDSATVASGSNPPANTTSSSPDTVGNGLEPSNDPSTSQKLPIVTPQATASPLSQSRRALPAWMQQTTPTLPEWQMKDEANEKDEKGHQEKPSSPPPTTTTPPTSSPPQKTTDPTANMSSMAVEPQTGTVH